MKLMTAITKGSKGAMLVGNFYTLTIFLSKKSEASAGLVNTPTSANLSMILKRDSQFDSAGDCHLVAFSSQFGYCIKDMPCQSMPQLAHQEQPQISSFLRR